MNEWLFPDFHAAGLDDRTDGFWDLSWPLPVVRNMPLCHLPGSVFKDWKFHRRRTQSRRPYRCDVRLKCLGCSAVTIYGVVVPESMVRDLGVWIDWRKGKQLLREAGFFDEHSR